MRLCVEHKLCSTWVMRLCVERNIWRIEVTPTSKNGSVRKFLEHSHLMLSISSRALDLWPLYPFCIIQVNPSIRVE